MLLMNNPKYRDRPIDLSLVFVKPDERGVCAIVSLPVTESDVQRVESEIGELINHTDKGTLLDEDCDDADCEFCALKKALFT
jgi:hypothetical protein